MNSFGKQIGVLPNLMGQGAIDVRELDWKDPGAGLS